jgi:hypothetical protein
MILFLLFIFIPNSLLILKHGLGWLNRGNLGHLSSDGPGRWLPLSEGLEVKGVLSPAESPLLVSSIPNKAVFEIVVGQRGEKNGVLVLKNDNSVSISLNDAFSKFGISEADVQEFVLNSYYGRFIFNSMKNKDISGAQFATVDNKTHQLFVWQGIRRGNVKCLDGTYSLHNLHASIGKITKNDIVQLNQAAATRHGCTFAILIGVFVVRCSDKSRDIVDVRVLAAGLNVCNYPQNIFPFPCVYYMRSTGNEDQSGRFRGKLMLLELDDIATSRWYSFHSSASQSHDLQGTVNVDSDQFVLIPHHFFSKPHLETEDDYSSYVRCIGSIKHRKYIDDNITEMKMLPQAPVLDEESITLEESEGVFTDFFIPEV